MEHQPIEGILLIDKPIDKTSFYLVKRLRALTRVQKIGHAGTLDPFATGLMILLIGKKYTKMSDQFLNHDKVYEATLFLGYTTPSFDKETEKSFVSSHIPTIEEVQSAIGQFQGEIEQTPPMYSAKKIGGTPLYELARQGKSVDRKACSVKVHIELLTYHYPEIKIRVACSKGTYIRSLGHDIGQVLETGAYLTELRRVESGDFKLDNAIRLDVIETDPALIHQHLIKTRHD